MPAFLIADIDITDPVTYEDYKRQVAPLIARFGGRYVARGGQHEVLEGDWEPHRLVVLEFPDMADRDQCSSLRLVPTRPVAGDGALFSYRCHSPVDKSLVLPVRDVTSALSNASCLSVV